jgi:DNA invertase Pin-like site-specific DNA recombinase
VEARPPQDTTKRALFALYANRALTNEVDPGGRYYNTTAQVSKLEALIERLPAQQARSPHAPKRPKPRRARQLSDQQVGELIEGYKTGETVYGLAERFKINRQTVSNALHRAGVQIRGRLTSEQIDQAVQLYASGWSLARIADKLATTADTVRTRLLQRAVRMRDTRGRER